jgi:hypothetical protein
LQRKASSRCGQGTPAGLPLGKPGMGDVIEGAVQQAAQAGRQFMAALCLGRMADVRASLSGGGLLLREILAGIPRFMRSIGPRLATPIDTGMTLNL